MKTIILIEDDDDTSIIIKYILENEGYHVIPFSDIISVNQIIEIGPDLILIDHRLSSGYGGRLCREVKANPISSNTPVILISVDPQIASIAIDNCADAYICKPFNLDDLINSVRSVVGDKTVS